MSEMVPLGLAWYQTRVVNCMFCGQMLPRRRWRDDRAPDQPFCGEACANRWLAARPNGDSPSEQRGADALPVPPGD